MGRFTNEITSVRRVLAAVFLFVYASQVFSGPLGCQDQMFSVDAENASAARQICEMAAEIRDKLESCGLDQTRKLTIEIVDQVNHPLGQCMAYFDCEYDLVRIKDPSDYDEILEKESVYSSLPSEVTFRALLTHELAHALVSQSARDREVPMVDHEYIAAAMELEFMEEHWRNTLLSRSPVELPPKEGLIDLWIYGFAPRKFGVNAWQHFSLPENGCGLIHRLVVGEETFSTAVRPELR